MFNRVYFILVVVFILCSGCNFFDKVTSSHGEKVKSDFVDGEVIVGLKKNQVSSFRNKFTKTEAQQMFKVMDVSVLDNKETYLHLKLQGGESVTEAIARISTYDGVDFVQPNYIYQLYSTPADPHYGHLWGLKNNGQSITSINLVQDQIKSTNNPGVSGFDISAESAWDVITDCSNVVVGILDSGAKLDHEDLVNNLWSNPLDHSTGYDAVDGDKVPDDIFVGHGTHVSTTIAAEGNNGKGATGVCWKAKIMPVRVCGKIECRSSDIITGISYAVAYGAKVINMSLGGSGATLDDLAYFGAVRSAENVLFVVSAGNNSSNNTISPRRPCNFSTVLNNVICVGAVDQSFVLADYSNFSSTAVQISAPGTNILGGSPSAEIVSTEEFTTGWVGDATNWALASSLTNPTNYDGTTNLYANSLRSAVYKTFNFATATSVLLDLDVIHFLENNADYLRIGFDRSTGTNIFDSPTVSFAEMPPLTGDGITQYHKSYVPETPSTAIDISSVCAGQVNCTIGFQFQSDFSIRDYGVQVTNMKLSAITATTNSYKIISGTSMATPHVTGVAALVWSYNPQYTVADVKSAILNGGKLMPGLAGKTSTSRVLNAMGSLAYIAKPSTPEISVK